MPTYYHRICDRSGRTLQYEKVELSCLQEAMVTANSRVRKMMRQTPHPGFDPNGRIEIVDCDGQPVARIYCAEAIAASR